MSDTPQGEGWWKANDGRWYAPERHPDYVAPPPPPPPPPDPEPSASGWGDSPSREVPAPAPAGQSQYPSSSRSRRSIVFGVAAVVVAVAGIVGFAVLGSDGSDSSSVASTGASSTTSGDCPEGQLMGDSGCKPYKSSATSSTLPTPTTAAPFEPLSYSGDGAQVVDVGKVVTVPMLAVITHDGTEEFQVDLLDGQGQRDQSLISYSTGAYLGVLPVNFESYHSFQFIQVKATGPWSINMTDPRSAPTASTEPGQTYTGAGEQVVFFQTSKPTTVRIACTNCESNFQVHSWSTTSSGLVNEIGAWSGEVLVPAGNILLDVFTGARGGPAPTWTITPL